MITICSVLLENIKNYEEIFVESILKKTKLVSEVIFAVNDASLDFKEEFVRSGIKFRKFGNNDNHTKSMCCGSQHGYGLNNCIDRAENDLVFLCDPDIFFYTAADEFYYKLMDSYDLQAVGCSHHAATELGQRFFPWHGNILMRRSTLPSSYWLEEEIPIKGKFLLAGIGTNYKEIYPNPKGNFDTSSGLWLWAHRQNWRWLAFQTTSVNVYTTKYFRGNVKIKPKFQKENLIYHAVSGAISEEGWPKFIEAYRNQ